MFTQGNLNLAQWCLIETIKLLFFYNLLWVFFLKSVFVFFSFLFLYINQVLTINKLKGAIVNGINNVSDRCFYK